MKSSFLFILLSLLSLITAQAFSADYKTVDVASVLYDSPSTKGKKLFVIKRETPVEIIISIDRFHKVRDAEGALAWIEKKALADRRTLLVIADKARVYQKADESSPLLFEAEKNVAFDYVGAPSGGFIKIKHKDGAAGFVRQNQVWGF